MIAQHLYENGFITYMRTDSLNLSTASIQKARNYIQQTFGKNYIPEKPNYYKAKSKLVQEAHEAIRPTNPSHSAQDIKKSLNKDEEKLYNLI